MGLLHPLTILNMIKIIRGLIIDEDGNSKECNIIKYEEIGKNGRFTIEIIGQIHD